MADWNEKPQARELRNEELGFRQSKDKGAWREIKSRNQPAQGQLRVSGQCPHLISRVSGNILKISFGFQKGRERGSHTHISASRPGVWEAAGGPMTQGWAAVRERGVNPPGAGEAPGTETLSRTHECAWIRDDISKGWPDI